MFEQCLAFQPLESASRRLDVFDPCCGVGLLITTLGLLYRDRIGFLAASDASAPAIELAAHNLALLDSSGLEERIGDLLALYEAHRKPSHAAALESARALRAGAGSDAVATTCFLADATDAAALRAHLGDRRPDIVVTDLPYGRQSAWLGLVPDDASPSAPIRSILDALLQVTAGHCVLALATERRQHVLHPGYERLRQLKIGGRRITWLRRLEQTG
jgi:hypothetical protein